MNSLGAGKERGYSLIEALVVLALIGALLVISIPLLSQMLFNYRVQMAVSQLEIQFRFARNACVSQKVPYRVVVRTQSDSPPNTYLVQKEDPPSSGTFINVKNMDFQFPTGVVIKNTSTAGPYTFNSRGGCSTSGHIDLESSNGQQYQLIVRLIGTVQKIKL